jgi:hypothetical protein
MEDTHAGLGRALAAARRDREAIVELEWALPRLERRPKGSAGPLQRTRLALADVLWRRAQGPDRGHARFLAETARDEERNRRASLHASDPLGVWEILLSEHLLADIETWLKAHK